MTDMVLPEKKTKNIATPMTQSRSIYRQEAMDAVARFRVLPDSKQYVIRFSTIQSLEHYGLLISFVVMGVTGLAQTFSYTGIGDFILRIFGGMDAARETHRVAAIILGMQFIYHVFSFLYQYVKWGNNFKIMPVRRDASQFIQMIKYNLGKTRQYPRFDRFNFEEKITYWALVLGVVLMGITGLLQWFPVAITYYLPGWVVPFGRIIHKWEAILLVLFILVWHIYHSTIKKFNKSIFTGLMSIEDMKRDHPLELEYLEKSAAAVNSQSWPVKIEIRVDEETPHEDHENMDESKSSKMQEIK